MGTIYFPQQHTAANISKKLMELPLDCGVYPKSHDGRPPQSVQAMRRMMNFYFREEPELDKPVLTSNCGATCQREQKETAFGIGIGMLVIA